MKRKNVRSMKVQKKEIKDLDQALETIVVLHECKNQSTETLAGWFAVANDDGIIAYFSNEKDAYRFRLDYINRILNP